MKRVIYCPTSKEVEEANELSLLTRLQIQIGDSEKTKNLSFDREKIQVVEIPEINELFSLPVINQYFHQTILYINEFLVLKNNIQLKIDKQLIDPVFQEKHRVKYSYFCEDHGVKYGTIYVDNKLIREFDFVVNKKI